MTARLNLTLPPLRIIFREARREVLRPAPVLSPARVRFIQSPAFTRSRAWVDLRYDFLRDREGRCRCCGRGSADGAKINVDHILPRKTHPQFALAYGNLQALCSVCNRGKGSRDQTDWRFHRPAEIAATPLCDVCKVPMIARHGPRGEFWGCARFPECRATKPRGERMPNGRRPRSTKRWLPRR